ncbi:MAG TPA: hypothetical protein DCY41_05670 [Opitutae bacterium]|nr:hypothetical protein [Opitutae bacterium]
MAAMSLPITRPGLSLVRLLKWIGIGTVSLLALTVLGVWLAGRSIPSVIHSALFEKAKSGFVCEKNDSNLFIGRIDLADASILNPPEFFDREFVHIRRLVVDVDAGTFLGDGRRVIDEVTLELDRINLIGKNDIFRDNNASALAKAFSQTKKKNKSTPQSSGSKEVPGEGFVIRRLLIRVGGVTLLQDNGNRAGSVMLKDDREISFEAKDVTAENLSDSVLRPLAGIALTRAAATNPETLLEQARRQVERIK